MIQVNDISLQFGSRKLFEDVNIKFTKGNCYGIIGANGAGKSTFLKIIAGDIEPTSGNIAIGKRERTSILTQDQEAFNDKTVLQTVILGHKRLTDIMEQKEKLYALENFTDEDGILLGHLEAEFAELDGWNAESDAESLLDQLSVPRDCFDSLMGDLDSKIKVKVLLAQALFSNPDNLILDEPTNNLDVKAIRWLEDFLLNFENTILIVSHNRHFLNKVCTHTCDLDYNKINLYTGNYDFWYESSQLALKQQKDINKKAEARVKELQEFIARFSANASKSKQATSRKRELDKMNIDEIKPSTRKYPFIDFKFEQRIGNEILEVKNLTKPGLFEKVSFVVQKDEKVAFLSDNSAVISVLFDILSGEDTDYTGEVRWGKTITTSYLPVDNTQYFEDCDCNLIEWIGQFSKERDVTYLRGWLGRMLFSGEESLKSAKVLSGGEKMRCMMARMMLKSANCLIMDEPTNHLDLESITALNNGMKRFTGNILFSTHDEEIIETVATKIIRINKTKEFDKSIPYSEYTETEM